MAGKFPIACLFNQHVCVHYLQSGFVVSHVHQEFLITLIFFVMQLRICHNLNLRNVAIYKFDKISPDFSITINGVPVWSVEIVIEQKSITQQYNTSPLKHIYNLGALNYNFSYEMNCKKQILHCIILI